MNTIKIIVNVLEDEEWIHRFIKEIFSDDALYEITCYSEPEPFINAFNQDVDLIITDIKILGYDVVENLKAFSKINPGCYLVVISGYLDSLYDVLINECNVDRTVEKTSDLSWLKLLRDRVESLKPKILGKSKFIPSHV